MPPLFTIKHTVHLHCPTVGATSLMYLFKSKVIKVKYNLNLGSLVAPATFQVLMGRVATVLGNVDTGHFYNHRNFSRAVSPVLPRNVN